MANKKQIGSPNVQMQIVENQALTDAFHFKQDKELQEDLHRSRSSHLLVDESNDRIPNSDHPDTSGDSMILHQNNYDKVKHMAVSHKLRKSSGDSSILSSDVPQKN